MTSFCGFPNIPDVEGRGTERTCDKPAKEHVHFDVDNGKSLRVNACDYHAQLYSILWPSWMLAEFIEKGKIKGVWE